MNIFRKINREFRRMENKIRTKKARDEFFKSETPLPHADISIFIEGGIGDYVVISRFWRDFLEQVGENTFDVYSKSPEIANWIFKSIKGFRFSFSDFLYHPDHPSYAYSFRINQMVFNTKRPRDASAVFKKTHKDTAILSAIRNTNEELNKIKIIAENTPHLDGSLGRYSTFKNRTRRDFLHYMARIPYGGDTLPIEIDTGALAKFGLTAGSYLTVHNGYSETMGVAGRRATKAYHDWTAVVSELDRLGVDLPIVQIGNALTSSPIGGVALNLIGKTTFAEAIAIVAGTRLHLDNESGIVHIASALGRESCVVFGPTSADYFGYPDNINIRPKICGDCWWSEPTWMSDCPRGLIDPICMTSHSAAEIAGAISLRIANKKTNQRQTNDRMPG